MNQQGEGFKDIGELFPYKTEAKIKQSILVGPEIRNVLKFEDFETKFKS